MPDQEPRSAAEDRAKQIISWASIAYACGFVTVTLHTWRLGLPVIELLHPIYVWIGLPLAIVGFFFGHISTLFRKRSVELGNEVREGWSHAVSPEIQGDISIAADLIGIIKAMPGFGNLLSASLIRTTEVLLLPKLQQAEEREKANDCQIYEKRAKRLHRLLGVFRIVAAGYEALNLVAIGVLICTVLALYVWELYPKIPQSLGGGRPSAVSLVVEVSALPKNFEPQRQSSASSTPQSEKETLSLPVILLYLTKDAFFVETQSHIRMSIKSDAVKSVVWGQSPTQLLPNTEHKADALKDAANVQRESDVVGQKKQLQPMGKMK